METVDASAVIVGVSLAILLMIIRVQSVLQDVLKAAIELASAKPATAAAETQTCVQVQDIWPGPARHNRVRQRHERAPDARFTVERIYAMDCLWDQLSADEKTAAAVLGYDQDGWDKKIPTNVSMTPWDELGVQCQHAVDFLGYSPELWDAEAAVAVDAEAAVAARRTAVAARRFQEIGGTGFGRFPEPRRAQAQVMEACGFLTARQRLMVPPVPVVGIRLDPENPESDDDSDGAPELVDNSD